MFQYSQRMRQMIYQSFKNGNSIAVISNSNIEDIYPYFLTFPIQILMSQHNNFRRQIEFTMNISWGINDVFNPSMYTNSRISAIIKQLSSYSPVDIFATLLQGATYNVEEVLYPLPLPDSHTISNIKELLRKLPPEHVINIGITVGELFRIDDFPVEDVYFDVKYVNPLTVSLRYLVKRSQYIPSQFFEEINKYQSNIYKKYRKYSLYENSGKGDIQISPLAIYLDYISHQDLSYGKRDIIFKIFGDVLKDFEIILHSNTSAEDKRKVTSDLRKFLFFYMKKTEENNKLPVLEEIIAHFYNQREFRKVEYLMSNIPNSNYKLDLNYTILFVNNRESFVKDAILKWNKVFNGSSIIESVVQLNDKELTEWFISIVINQDDKKFKRGRKRNINHITEALATGDHPLDGLIRKLDIKDQNFWIQLFIRYPFYSTIKHATKQLNITEQKFIEEVMLHLANKYKETFVSKALAILKSHTPYNTPMNNVKGYYLSKDISHVLTLMANYLSESFSTEPFIEFIYRTGIPFEDNNIKLPKEKVEYIYEEVSSSVIYNHKAFSENDQYIHPEQMVNIILQDHYLRRLILSPLFVYHLINKISDVAVANGYIPSEEKINYIKRKIKDKKFSLFKKPKELPIKSIYKLSYVSDVIEKLPLLPEDRNSLIKRFIKEEKIKYLALEKV